MMHIPNLKLRRYPLKRMFRSRPGDGEKREQRFFFTVIKNEEHFCLITKEMEKFARFPDVDKLDAVIRFDTQTPYLKNIVIKQNTIS